MATYTPAEHLQSLGEAQISKHNANHYQDYLAHGPPPRNYYAARTFRDIKGKREGAMNYADHSGTSKPTTRREGASWHHPLSTAGLTENPSPNILPEYKDDRERCIGWFQPPYEYYPGQFLWKQYSTWQGALAAALAEKGALNRSGTSVTEDDVTKFHANLAKNYPEYGHLSQRLLYHPADRHTAVFQDEPECAMTARLMNNKYSLAIVCPLIMADGKRWNYIWGTHDRPPMYCRFSTGQQGIYEPLMLACLPKQSTAGGTELKNREVYWCHLQVNPKSSFANTWTMMWDSYNLKALSAEFRLRNLWEVKCFLWILVLAHRKIVMGQDIDDADLGCWIWQYSEHLGAIRSNKNRKTSGFTYDATKKSGYTGRTISFQMLTAWIMSSKFRDDNNNSCQGYSRQWDDAFQARIDYHLDKTNEKWTVFKSKMQAARKFPWL